MIGGMTDDLDCMQACMTFLNVPLVEANTLEQGDVLVGYGFNNHCKMKAGNKGWEEDSLTGTSIKKAPRRCEERNRSRFGDLILATKGSRGTGSLNKVNDLPSGHQLEP
jgi:hypothetical protein